MASSGKQLSVDGLFGLLILLLFLGTLLPLIVTNLLAVNTSGWGTAEIALWGIVDLIIIAGIVYSIKKQMF